MVTGLGVMAPNGRNAREFFQNCQSGKTGIHIPEVPLAGREKLRTAYWGQIDEIPGYKEEFAGNVVYRSRALAKQALEEALSDAGLSREAVSELGDRAALITGSLSHDDYAVLEAARGDISYVKEETLSVYLRRLCGVRGGCYQVSPACASGTVAVGTAMELIRSGRCDVVLVCGVDALSKMVTYGFHSLKALSCGVCHPLDQGRDGINIGEGCGVLVLESREHALQRKAGIYAQCVSCAMGNEAFHITSPSPDGGGFFDSMHTALQGAALPPDELDYINLHGTGTRVNDQAELAAVEKLYAGAAKRPFLSSLKALTGHCMGAAGALEAVLTVLCLKEQQYFPLCGVGCPIEEIGSYGNRRHPIRYAMSNSFAFAGNTASVVFAGADVEAGETAVEKREVFLGGIGMIMPDISGIDEVRERLWQEPGVNEITLDSHRKNAKNSVFHENICAGEQEGKGAGKLERSGLECQAADLPVPGIPAKKLRGMTKLSKMVLSAALQAERDAGADHTAWDARRTGTVFSSLYGAWKDRIRFANMVEQEKPDLCSPTLFANTSPNAPLGHLCINMNCQKNSTSMQGTSPLLLAQMFVENGDCDRVFCCVAEEYNEMLAEKLEDKLKDKPTGELAEGQLSYFGGGDHCCQLFLQSGKSATTYCRIGQILTGALDDGILTGNPDEAEKERFLKLADRFCRQAETVPDAIFSMGGPDFIHTAERQIFMQHFPQSQCLSADRFFPGLGYDRFYVNIAAAALCLKEGTIPSSLCGVDSGKPSSIMVTGYDMCGNYYAVFLHDTELFPAVTEGEGKFGVSDG